MKAPWLLALFMICNSNPLLNGEEETRTTPYSTIEKDLPSMVFLYGPPGSGRSTIASKLHNDFSVPHLSFVDLLSTYAHEQDPLGERLTTYLQTGGDISQELFIEIFQKRLQDNDCAHGCIIEGAPWTLAQAQSLYDSFHTSFSFVALTINANDQWLVSKVQNRFVCPTCGRIYHEPFSHPKKEGVCDICLSTLTQRSLDTPEIMQTKLTNYRAAIMPVLDFFNTKHALITLEGDKTIDAIYYQVISSLSQYAHLTK